MVSRSVGSQLKDTLYFIANLQKHHEVAEQARSGEALNAQLKALRTWQSERLAGTHADFLTSSRYGPACRFFISEIYAPRDLSQREQDIEYLYEMMSRILPDFLLTLVRQAVELNNLTHALDNSLVHTLDHNLGATGYITPELYAEAYRICDNYDERAYQIELLIEVGQKVNWATRIPLTGTTLRLARGPARSAGWHELQDFLERGFEAFKHMRGAKKFLATIKQREQRILDNIFNTSPDPFTLR